MQDLISLISDTGISLFCVAYLIYFQSTTMKEMLNTLSNINNRLIVIEEHVGVHNDEKSS